MLDLTDRRILVVGASSGIGRAFAQAALGAGARLCVAARREEPLRELVEGHAGSCVASGDVRSEAGCQEIAARAGEVLGGLDALVYCAGITPLARLVDADADHWREVLETNLLGAVHVTRAALGSLAGGALVVFVSSDTVGRPREGLAAYSASKAALDESVLAWRREHPELRFLRIVVGPTAGTDLGNQFATPLAAELLPVWLAQGFMTSRLMQAADLGGLLAEALAVFLAHPEIAVEDLRVEPPGGPLTPTA